MKKTTFSIIISIILLLAITIPVAAITDGEKDGEGHPMVGMMVAKDADGDPIWRCSGTLISSTVFLTAGHCTESPAASAELWFDTDLSDNYCDKDEEGEWISVPGCYPMNGEVKGTLHTHPDYDPNAFVYHDAGIVTLNQAVILSEYGKLPEINQLDNLKSGKNGAQFIAVGYGLQESYPDPADWKIVSDPIRYVTYPFLLNIGSKGNTADFAMFLSNNHCSGGTCFGDSGGPNFILDGESNLVIAGITSFGFNDRCAGIGGVYRIDQADDLEWINSFLD